MTFPVNFCLPHPYLFMIAEDVTIEQTDAIEFQFGGFSIYLRGERWELEYFDAEEGTVIELLEDSEEHFAEDRDFFSDGSWQTVRVADLQKCKDFLSNKGESK